MIQDIVDADNLEEVMMAFGRRLNRSKRWMNCKPNKANIILERLNGSFEEWNSENTRHYMNKFANEYFTRNVTKPDIQKDPRNWHKCL